MTPRQKEAYLRNLVKRAAISVQIDPKLDAGVERDVCLDKLERWGAKLFDMGYRTALGHDIPREAPSRPEVVQSMAITFTPKGFRDVYWCGRLNEPVILKWKAHPATPDRQEKWCDGCDGPIEGNEGDHLLICHIIKPGKYD